MSAVRAEPLPCAPRLFVYDLPDRYRYEGRPEGQDFPLPLNMSGTEQPLRDFPAEVPLRAADTYVAGGIFNARALAHPCRTLDPSQADLFLIPAFTDAFNTKTPKICADASRNSSARNTWTCSHDKLFERMEAAAPGALQARNGSDHIVLVPRHGYPYDLVVSYEFKVTDPRLGKAMRFCMEEGNVKYSWPGLRTKAFFRSTPFASLVHAPPQTPWERLPWRMRPKRDVLIAIAFNAVHKAGPAVSQLNLLRDRLVTSCEAAGDPSVCAILPLSPTKVQVRGYHMRLLGRIASLNWRSTFCLQPVGDACTRKATIDALLFGCIPVLFHPCQTLQWPWHWGSWLRDAVVYIDILNVTRNASQPGFVDAVDALRRIPPAEIARMQHVIATHAHCLHYRTPGAAEASVAPEAASSVAAANDAFDITLKGSWILSRARREHPSGASRVMARGHAPAHGQGIWDFPGRLSNELNDLTGLDGLCKRVPRYSHTRSTVT